MGRGRVSETAPGADDARSAQGRGQAPAAPRCANVRRAAGLAVIERDGHWHIHGRLRIKGHVKRIRESTGLPATAANREAAEELRRQREGETRDAIIWGVRPSVPFEIAADQYLSRPRERPLNAIDIARLQELERRFRGRRLNRIEQAEWSGFVDARMKGRAPVTRERYIDTILAFLAWCQRRPRVWLGELPIFERDQKARQRTERRARRVGELRPDLIALLVASAPPHLRGQVAIMWSTGARVSSIIYGCRLCDYLAAEGREQITFHDTKNGDRVTATVHPWAAGVMRDYLAWRGQLQDREAPLFLTDRRLPYADNNKAAGGQTKNAFRPMIMRACRRLRGEALREAIELRRSGEGAAARERWRAMRSDIALLRQVTPHWFRHLLATTLLATGDIESTKRQGGWRDVRSIMGYSHDVPERRRALIAGLPTPSLDTPWTREAKSATIK